MAANHASAYYHSLINGTAVALHWDPVNYAPLLNSTAISTGRQLYQSSCSDPAHLEVLVSATKTLLINKRATPVPVLVDGEAVNLDKYGIMTLVFSIEHADYFKLTDSAVIISDTTLLIELTGKLADIRFEVGDAEGPLASVLLMVNDISLTTDSEGIIIVSNQAAREEYTYSILEPFYEPFRDTFYLETDTIVRINRESNTSVWDYSLELLELYPNPASNEFSLNLSHGDEELSIISMDGQLVMDKKNYQGARSINVSETPEGCYFLKIQSGNNIGYRKIIIVR